MRHLIISGLLSCGILLSGCASPEPDPSNGQSSVQKRDKDADDTFTGSRIPAKR